MPRVAVGSGRKGVKGRWQYGGYSKQHVQKCAHCADANTNAIKHSINEGEQEWELEGNKVCRTPNSTPRRLLSVVATEAEITQ